MKEHGYIVIGTEVELGNARLELSNHYFICGYAIYLSAVDAYKERDRLNVDWCKQENPIQYELSYMQSSLMFRLSNEDFQDLKAAQRRENLHLPRNFTEYWRKLGFYGIYSVRMMDMIPDMAQVKIPIPTTRKLEV